MYRTPTSDAAGDIDVAALWQAVGDRKLWLLGWILAVGAATFLTLSTLTPRYTSEARILIENDETAFTRPASGEASPVPLDQEAVASQVEVLRSRDLALEAVDKLGLAELPEFNPRLRKLGKLQQLLSLIGLVQAPDPEAGKEAVADVFIKRVAVSQVNNSRVITIAFTSQDRHLAARGANWLAEAYLAWQQRERLAQNRSASQWLEAQIEMLRQKVAESEEAVEKFRSATGLVAGGNNITLGAQQLSELNSQLILAKAQRTEAEARAELINKMLKETGDVDASPDVLRSELIQRLLEQRVQLQRQLAELSSTLLPSHPRIRQLRAELADLRKQIRDEAKKIVASLENEAQIAGAREASLRASLNELKSDASLTSENQIKLRALEREAKAHRDLLESYLVRHREASGRSDPKAVPAYASIISRASVASKPSFPRTTLVTLLAMAATAFLGLAVVLTRELIALQSVPVVRQPRAPRAAVRDDDAHHAAPRTEPRFAATAGSSAAPTRPAPSPVVRAGPHAGAANLRHVAELIRASVAGKPEKRVLITPTRRTLNAAGEAVEIARRLAGDKQRVMLVDLSETEEGIVQQLGLRKGHGIGELAAGVVRFEDVVRRDPKSAVHLIGQGHPRLNPALKEDDASFAKVLGALDRIYDVVLLYGSGTAAHGLLAGLGDSLASIVAVASSDSLAGASFGGLDSLLSDPRFTVKLIRYQRKERAPGLLARMPFLGRTAAA